ncbi:hypothetical protein BOTBODRAFT_187790 [Botryobasidium botryosum FD-172 SS1]|uniref:Protein kinase domain-containing protein n=1 Tax=Botryobasidium botryosum (strain FD-172 SS1) TaxID=930990 RepID=A0A067MFZ2_BOTB1|nr:hypothetical protein BOTBODRAFT_187790 [Botryobasidium botryosum FD-172 SS1]
MLKQDCDKYRTRAPITRDERSFECSVYAEVAYTGLARKFEKWGSGPMPVLAFIDAFLPQPETGATPPDMPSPAGAFDRIPADVEHENEIYEPLIAALNETVGTIPRCPGFYFRATRQRLRRRYAPIRAMQESFGQVKLSSCEVFRDPPPTDAPADTTFLTFSTDDIYDGYDECQALSQNIRYASTILAEQHRWFLLSILVTGRMVRFMRWDRAGAVVSGAFDCVENPEPLCLFLWRYAHFDDIGRGYDPTVQWATQEEEDLFTTAVRAYVGGHSDESEVEATVKTHYEEGRVAVIKIYDEAAEERYRRCIVSRPVAAPFTVFGRATRGYWAVDADTGKVGFLKDTWRLCKGPLITEGEVLRILQGAQVRNVPGLICHGDVGGIPGVSDQRTRTNDYITCSWARQSSHLRITPRVHYRMFSAPAGYPLSSFKDSRELLKCARDVYHTIIDAYHRLELFHRDISMGNIIIVRDEHRAPTAYLIDWELSPMVQPGWLDHVELRGTLQYKSARLLAGLYESPYDAYDDLESIFWVFLYAIFKFKFWKARAVIQPMGDLPARNIECHSLPVVAWLSSHLLRKVDRTWEEARAVSSTQGTAKDTPALTPF